MFHVEQKRRNGDYRSSLHLQLLPQLFHCNLPGLDSFSLRKFQVQNSIFHSGFDPLSVNRRVQLKAAPEIAIIGFPVESLSARNINRSAPDDRQLISFQEDFQALLVHAWHLCFEQVPIRCFSDIHLRVEPTSALLRGLSLQGAIIRFLSMCYS